MAISKETGLDSKPLDSVDLEARPAPQTRGIGYVFFGADGLRAGWGLLIYIAMIAGGFYSLHFVRTAIVKHSASSIGEQDRARSNNSSEQPSTEASKPLGPRAAFVREGPPLLVVLLATLLMARIERRPLGAFGLSEYRCTTRFFAGGFWGVVCLSLLISLLHLLGYLQFDGRLLNGNSALRYGVLWAIGFFLVALLEEILIRGYAQYTLARGLAGIYGSLFKNTRHRDALGFWTAALILSFIFGIGHSRNPGESPIGLLGAGLAGLVFCFSLYRTGSLWWAIGLHTTWDWSQSFLYGVADSGLMAEGHLFATHPVGRPILSGGLTGPEGSIFAILMLVVIAGIILVTLRPSHEPHTASKIEL